MLAVTLFNFVSVFHLWLYIEDFECTVLLLRLKECFFAIELQETGLKDMQVFGHC